VKLDRDLVIAGLILQDWGKVWLLFDDATGTIKEPDWYPKAWGTKAVKLDRERLAIRDGQQGLSQRRNSGRLTPLKQHNGHLGHVRIRLRIVYPDTALMCAGRQ
jgi:hypothetical protein